ncbi:LysM peptidoglycan-binding domain-containing protein [Kocuria sp. CNJ-770]|uniref:LysM peptidoglycan-binding domain-containing protein n=1 Tax=Kocuria sp. CNJ-770 TaxID=1904964 RepID=UPI000AD5A804|nr:LysM domain-containing protein [Kocuria sp. CNJ-770]
MTPKRVKRHQTASNESNRRAGRASRRGATAGSASRAAAELWPALLLPALGLSLAASGAVLLGGVPGGERSSGIRGITWSAAAEPEQLLGLAAAGLGCAVVLVWTAAAALAVLAVLAGHHRWERLGRLCGRCSPALLRRAAAAALGLQLVAAPGAVADDAPSPFWSGGTAVHGPSASVPDGPTQPSAAPADLGAAHPAPLPPPVVPVAPSAPSTGEAPRFPGAHPAPAERTVDGAVTVLRGDTLWSLAAAQLGPGASAAEVDRAWPAWYELNRHVLPHGPHLLLPGQRLVVPGTGDH